LGLSLILALGVLLALGVVLSNRLPGVARASGPLNQFWVEDFSAPIDPAKYYVQATTGSGVISNDSFLLTQDATSQRSRIWYSYTHTLMTEFTATFRLNFGNSFSPTLHAGGDGIVFAICPHYLYELPRSSGLTDAQCPGGYLLDFDTNESFSYPTNEDRVYVAFEDQAERLAQQDVADLEKGLWYTATVEFNMGTMNVALNGSRVITDAHLPDYVPFWGYFGFAANTSGAWNPQQVDDIQVYVAPAQAGQQNEILVDRNFGPATPGWGVTATNSITRAMWMVEPRGSVQVNSGTYATTWVMPLINGGRYTPTLWLRPRVSIRGSGPWATTLDGQGLNRTVWGDYNISASEVFSGFTVQGGHAYDWRTQAGGGLDLWAGTEKIVNCRIIGNAGLWGGGVALLQSNATLINLMVVDNQAQYYGSGIYVLASTGPRLLNNTIAHNLDARSSGVYITGTSTAAMTNTILAGETTGVFAAVASSHATLHATLWGAGAWANAVDTGGLGSIQDGLHNSGDPAFVNAAAGDYHIGANSPARNWAANLAEVSYDIDDQRRIYDEDYWPDVGADEYQPFVGNERLYLPLLTH
jgi:parallel beta-helix repeat protein